MHQAKQGKPPPTSLSGFQRNHPRKPIPSTPKKPFKKYDGPVYVPAEVYKLLSPEAVTALKKYNTEAINKAPKKRGIHVTDITDHESPHLMYLQMRLTQFWTTSIANITRKKI